MCTLSQVAVASNEPHPAPLPAVTSQAKKKKKSLVLDFDSNSAYIICFFGQHAFNWTVSCAIERFDGFTVFLF